MRLRPISVERHRQLTAHPTAADKARRVASRRLRIPTAAAPVSRAPVDHAEPHHRNRRSVMAAKPPAHCLPGRVEVTNRLRLRGGLFALFRIDKRQRAKQVEDGVAVAPPALDAVLDRAAQHQRFYRHRARLCTCNGETGIFFLGGWHLCA